MTYIQNSVFGFIEKNWYSQRTYSEVWGNDSRQIKHLTTAKQTKIVFFLETVKILMSRFIRIHTFPFCFEFWLRPLLHVWTIVLTSFKEEESPSEIRGWKWQSQNDLSRTFGIIYNTEKHEAEKTRAIYSTRRFDVCLSVCHFVLVFFSPFSIVITSLREERANLSVFRTFVRFVLV